MLWSSIAYGEDQKWDYYTEKWITPDRPADMIPEPKEPAIKSGPKPVAYVLSNLALSNEPGVVVYQTGYGSFVTVRVEFVKYVWLEPDGVYETNSEFCKEDDELGVICQ
jgi:hypothetical protein